MAVLHPYHICRVICVISHHPHDQAQCPLAGRDGGGAGEVKFVSESPVQSNLRFV